MRLSGSTAGPPVFSVIMEQSHQSGDPEMGERKWDRLALYRSGQTPTKCLPESFNGSLRDELLNEEMFDSLTGARRKLALWRYNYNNVRPHSSLGNKTPAEAGRTLEPFEGAVPGALAQTETKEYGNQTRRLSL